MQGAAWSQLQLAPTLPFMEGSIFQPLKHFHNSQLQEKVEENQVLSTSELTAECSAPRATGILRLVLWLHSSGGRGRGRYLITAAGC